MENQTIVLNYGLLSDLLSDQLDAQGLKYDKKQMTQFQKQLDAVNILCFGDLLTDSLIDKTFSKLHKKVIAHVVKENGQKVIKHNDK